MKKVIAALGGAALLSLAMLGAPAHAQSHGPFVQAQVYVTPPPPPPPPGYYRAPPPPRYAHPGYHDGPRYRHGGPRHWERERRRGWRDDDRDGVPNRYDRRPHNPYRY